MKLSKKIISVILSLTMIMSAISVCFVTFAAGPSSATEADWTALMDALKNDYVKSAPVQQGTNTVTITDNADGDVLKAMQAYVNVFDKVSNFDTSTTGSSTKANLKYRTAALTGKVIEEQLQNLDSEAFTAYNMGSVLAAFRANTTMNSGTSTSSGTFSSNGLTLTVKIKSAPVAAILAATTVDDIPASTSVNVFSFVHIRQSYKGSGWFASTYYYLHLKAKTAASTESAAFDSSALKTLDTAVNSNEAYFSKTFEELLADENTSSVYQALSDAYAAAIAVFSDEIINHFFNAEAIVNLLSDLIFVNEVKKNLPVCEAIMADVNTDYSEFTPDELQDLYTDLKTKYDSYKAITDEDVKAYLVANDKIDTAKVEEVLPALLVAKELAQLKVYKAEVDADKAIYAAYNEDDVIAGTVTLAMLNAAIGKINGHKTALATYDAENVEAIFGDDYVDGLTALVDDLTALIGVDGYNKDFASKYQKFTSEIYSAINIDDDSADLMAAVKNYDNWYTELEAFCEEIKTELGEETANKILKTYADEMKSNMASRYAVLGARSKAEIDVAYAKYLVTVSFYGPRVQHATLESFRELTDAIGMLDADLYTFLDETTHYEIAADTALKYETLKAIVADFKSFIETAGFDRYQQSEYDEIIRYVSDRDNARDKDYAVTDEKVAEILTLLDKVLYSDEITELIGTDLSEYLGTALLENVIYTDEFLNTLIKTLYPLIANVFVDIWAGGLPKVVDTQVSGIDVKVSVDYLSVEEALNNVKLYLMPTLLGKQIETQYPDVAAKLKSVTSVAYNMETDERTDPWSDPAICDEDGNLTLEWGITDKASFVNAAVAGLKGLEPLLLALLSNVSIEGKHSSAHDAYLNASSPAGCGLVATGTANALNFANVGVDAINLYLDVEGNSGYNNAIAPIFEALGIRNLPDGDTLTSTRALLEEGLIAPLEQFLTILGEKPVETILVALPNIAQTLETNRVLPLLSKLSLNIFYHADAHQKGYKLLFITIAEPGWVAEALKDGPLSVDVGAMIDFDSMGIDVSSLNGLLNSVMGLLGLDITLPEIDSTKLATLGELQWIDTVRKSATYKPVVDGKAAYIKADLTDVLVFVLDYIVKAAQDEDFLKAVISAFNNGDAEEGEDIEEVVVEIPEIVKEIITNIANNENDAIAAIAELILPVDYDMPLGIDWVETVDSETYETLTDEEKANVVVVDGVEYSNIWTKDKAEYVVDNLPTFIDNVLMILGVLGVTDKSLGGSLSELVTNLVSSLYTADTANKIVEAINGVVSGIELPEALADIVKDLIGVDFGYWSELSYDFESGNKAAFKAAIVETLAPLTKVLQFMLADEDIALKLTDADGKFNVVTLQGYEGYSFGLVPALEALNADVMTTEAFLADKDNLVANIVTMLLSAVDKIEEAPYEQIVAILPNVLYFLASDGLSVASDNLLFALNVALDTIRPIYDVNIYDLIDFDLRFAEFDPISFLFSQVAGSLAGAGLDFDIDFTSADLLSLLSFDERETYTSANGYEAYKVTMSDELTADMLTAILRFVLGEFVYSENAGEYAKLAYEKFDLTDEQFAMLFTVLSAMKYLHNDGPDYTMGILFWVFFGADTAVDATLNAFDTADFNIENVLANLESIKTEASDKAAYVIATIYKTVFEALWTSSEKVESILAEVQKRIDDSVAKFDEEINKIPAQVDDVLAEILAEVEKSVNDAKDKINDTMGDVQDKVDETLDDIKDKVQEGVDDAKDKVEEGLGDAQDKVDETLGDITDKVQGGVDDVNDKLNGVADDLNNVNNQMNGIFAKILEFFQNLVAKIKALFGIK